MRLAKSVKAKAQMAAYGVMWAITSRSSLVHRDMSQDVVSGAWALPHERRAWALVEHRWHGRLILPTQAQMQLVGLCVPAPLSCHTADGGLRMLQGHNDSCSRLQTKQMLLWWINPSLCPTPPFSSRDDAQKSKANDVHSHKQALKNISTE